VGAGPGGGKEPKVAAADNNGPEATAAAADTGVVYLNFCVFFLVRASFFL
jgi:hypothetical protein